eukprot:2866925-Rhodomonas_salina.1
MRVLTVVLVQPRLVRGHGHAGLGRDPPRVRVRPHCTPCPSSVPADDHACSASVPRGLIPHIHPQKPAPRLTPREAHVPSFRPRPRPRPRTCTEQPLASGLGMRTHVHTPALTCKHSH